jgi:hypothetical protein
MEKYLITLTIRTRVDPDPNHVVKALELARNHKATLWLLGTKGSRRTLRGEQVVHFTPQQYTDAARHGLLYIELDGEAYPDRAPVWAFAPGVDADTGLPVLMETYDHAFAMRSHAGTTTQQPSTLL